MFTVAILAQGTILGANATRRPFLCFAVRVLVLVVFCVLFVWVCVVCVKKFVFRDSRTWVLGLGFGFGVLGVLGFLVFGVGGFSGIFSGKNVANRPQKIIKFYLKRNEF